MTRKLLSLRAPPAKGGPFQCVGIRCPLEGCLAARRREDERFLCDEAPPLPLADCDRAADCRCSYRHFSDRRHEPRRSADAGVPSIPRNQSVEQRHGNGRRLADSASDDPLDDTYYGFVEKQ